ncbi:DUF6233 domain-containing protein [Streptomyces sp. NPDC058398]|uniref:DUF6233 domain-containing protein n=1 Tax=Streptomyces sp. NPDC058398 TaxID=3346479 RepID=UPI003659D0B0
MNDSPALSRLDQLPFLKRVQEQDLERTRRWIAAEEQRLQEQRRGEQARPPAPDWLLERGLDGHTPPVYVHRGDCHMAGKRSRGITEEQARHALGDQVPACTHCRPDTELGLLD